MKGILTGISIICVVVISGQPIYDSYNPFNKDPNSRSHGLYGGLGINYTVPAGITSTTVSANEISGQVSTFSQKGKFNLFAEFGKWHYLTHSPFQSIEYGFTYRKYAGVESFSTNIRTASMDSLISTGESSFKSHYAHFNVFFNRATRLSELSFIQTSIGADVGYRFINNISYAGDPYPLYTSQEIENEITSHVNLRIAYATRVNRTYWIPFVQAPIFDLTEASFFEATMPFFNSRYYPVIFGLRLQWLHLKPGVECAKKGPKTKKQKKASESLFGKDFKNKQLRK